MSSRDSFVVFYSNKCSHCREFLTQLRDLKTGLYEEFTKICVDGNASIPKSIQSVPTLLVPSHDYPLTDKGVFMWLSTMAGQYGRKEVQAGGPGGHGGGPTGSSGAPAPAGADEGIAPYVAGEMGSCFSDSFSFLDSDAPPLAHSFSFLGSGTQGGPNGGPPPGPQGGPIGSRGPAMGAPPMRAGQFQGPPVTADTLGRPSLSNESRSCSSFDTAYENYISSRDNDLGIPQQPRRVG